jgi:hypothetical protein
MQHLFGKDGAFRWSISGFSLWRAGGEPLPFVYGFGFWCGKDGDLLCIRKFCEKETSELELFLSPLKCNPLLALAAFLISKHYQR